jgi:glycosyltransferase involved in cell wall biosynthesis
VTNAPIPTDLHTIAVVVPVYQGERTLTPLIAELAPFFAERTSEDGHHYRVAEVILVHDGGPDRSDRVLRELEATHAEIRAVWLSRNYGQHAATLAGIASSGSDWIVTLDEDGQHDPADIPRMLDTAMAEQAAVVYARPVNAAPHGPLRNLSSRWSKRLISAVSEDPHVTMYQSYRLILGEVGRATSAYAGHDVYLDVAIGWVTSRVAQCDIELRAEGERDSGYSLRKLVAHFWRMFLTSGTRGLRFVSLFGAGLTVLGIAFAVFVLIGRLFNLIVEPGWASLMIVLIVAAGAILFSIGVVAEYLGVAVNSALGRPAYVMLSDIALGPLGRRPGTPIQVPAGTTRGDEGSATA